MKTVKVQSFDELLKAIDADHRRIMGSAYQTAIGVTARRAVAPIRRRAPVAFGDLSESVHATESATVVDAPHAGSVEVGSPPHRPDMNRLIEWVKLRGRQGLNPTQKGYFGPGSTTAFQARRVSQMFADHVQGRGMGAHSPVETPEIVANRIARAIEEHGTAPHFFVRSSLEEIREILGEEITRSLHTV